MADREDTMANADAPPPEPNDGGRSVGFLARLLLWLGILSAAFVIFVIVAPIDPWFPAATRQAREVDNLFRFMLAASSVIFIYVQGLVLIFALRYRRRTRGRDDRGDALGPMVHGNTRLEIAWTAAPSVLLVVLVILSLRVWTDEQGPGKNALLLNVRAYQFGYAFSLPQYGIKEVAPVTIPLNRPIYVTETSSDVIHSFWVPQFRVKQDAVPGLVTHEYFVPITTGTFPVICTEFCGVGHSSMNGELTPSWRITVASEARFVAWLRTHGATHLSAGGATAARVQP